MSRLREGRANTARGAAHFLRETVGRVRYGGARGQLTVRADRGFYTHSLVAVCRAMDVRFSITIRQHKSLRNLIEAIPETDWTPIPYWMDGAAAVAETTYTSFQNEPDAAPVRLIVRRVKPTPGSQLALFASYSYHGCITDRDGETLALEADHRRHAEIENAIRDLKYGVGLNHLPSGRFAANGAWLAVQVMAHNLARWTTRIGLDEQLATTKTLRRRFCSIAGRLTHSARRPLCIFHSAGLGKPSSVAPSLDCEPCHFRPDGAAGADPPPDYPNRLADSRSVAPRAPLAACCPDHLAQHRHRGPSTSPLRAYRTLHSAKSIGIKPSRLFPLPLIPCLTHMATSLRWIRLNERDHNAAMNLSNWPGLSFPVSGRGDRVSPAMPAVVGEASTDSALHLPGAVKHAG